MHMFFCSAWNAKKDKSKYRTELDESPRSRRRLLKVADRIGDVDSDLDETDEAYSSAAEVDSARACPNSGFTKTSGSHSHGPRLGGGGLVTEVLLDFEPLPDREGRELSVKKGDIVRVLFRSGQWLYVTMGLGKEGYVPAGYCRAFAPPEMQAAASNPSTQEEHTSSGVGSPSTDGRHETKFERGSLVVALYGFRAQERDDLSLRKGERLTVTHTGDGAWVWVRNSDGREGCVPATYVSVAEAIKPAPKMAYSSDDRRDSELLKDILSTVSKRHRNPTAPTTRGRSSNTSTSHSDARGENKLQQTSGEMETKIMSHPSVRAHSAMDLREAGTRGMVTAGLPVARQRQRHNPQLRRFAPKLQRPNLAPINEAEQGNRARRDCRLEVRAHSPSCDHTSNQEVDKNSRRPNQRPSVIRPKQQLSSLEGLKYDKHHGSRAASFQHVAGGYGRALGLPERILTSQSLRPSDFSFDNISQLLREQATGQPCILSDKLETPTPSMRSTTSDGSSGGSTSPPMSSPARRLDINRLQIEARLRLSHSRLGIHSSFASIPMISTSPHQPRRPVPPPITPEQSWSYSHV